MQRIFNVTAWTVIEPGQVLEYPLERARLVRLEVNASEDANLFLLDAGGEAYHLARVRGRDTIEFVSPGPFSLSAADGAISVYTVDGTSGHRTVEAPQSFTTIVERRRRSPEIDAMMRVMNSNMERRLAQQADELAKQFERREREREARAIRAAGPEQGAGSSPAGVSGDAAAEPAPELSVEDGGGSGRSAPGAKGKGRGAV